jgi:HPt (histidine-containing phosphotransfer) domain-containing protein
MAFNSNAAVAERGFDPPPARRLPVDLNHLHSQTFGDRKLQREVLKLFLRHSADQFERLKEAISPEERREVAHTLVGSARGVGAFSVAYIAAEIELSRGPIVGRMKALEAAISAVQGFIRDFLAD